MPYICPLSIEPLHKYVPLPKERKNVEVTRRLADTSKAAALIGFKAEISLMEGLKGLVWWLDQTFNYISSSTPSYNLYKFMY